MLYAYVYALESVSTQTGWGLTFGHSRLIEEPSSGDSSRNLDSLPSVSCSSERDGDFQPCEVRRCGRGTHAREPRLFVH